MSETRIEVPPPLVPKVLEYWGASAKVLIFVFAKYCVTALTLRNTKFSALKIKATIIIFPTLLNLRRSFRNSLRRLYYISPTLAAPKFQPC